MSVGLQLIIAGLVGVALGFLVGWVYGRTRHRAPEDGRLEHELRQQVAQREAELAHLRGQFAEAASARAGAEASRAAAEKLVAEQRELQTKALADLRDSFKALSADTLKQTAPEFLRLAEQSFGKLQESAKGDIKGLVEPLKQQLETYQKRLHDAETTQADTLGRVKEQMEKLALSNQTLASETQQFRMVLRSNQARGRWGEETLRRVVEAAGMSAHCDFTEQTKEGDGQPDLVVRLPGERVIIVDAKVPDLDFLNALETADPMKRAAALEVHAAKLKETIKGLAARDYPSQFSNALDYVILFVPAESLFSAALEGDHDLIVWAAEKRILLATPASLIALLRSVAVSWQQHAQTENAKAIAEAAEELFHRVTKFAEHFERIGDGLQKANHAFNDAVGSYERMVRPSGERIVRLGGASTTKELPEIQPVEGALRLSEGN